MTNLTPKFATNKIERPNSNSNNSNNRGNSRPYNNQQRHQNGSAAKSQRMTNNANNLNSYIYGYQITAINTSSGRYFYNLNASSTTVTSPNNNGLTRTPSSPPWNIPGAKGTPSRSTSNSESSPRGSPTSSFYAGAKFSEPPSPASLPKPPSHWTGLMMASSCSKAANRGSSQLTKMLINVQA